MSHKMSQASQRERNIAVLTPKQKRKKKKKEEGSFNTTQNPAR
jgi:hypothetical protein